MTPGVERLGKPTWTSDLSNYKIINVCYFKLTLFPLYHICHAFRSGSLELEGTLRTFFFNEEFLDITFRITTEKKECNMCWSHIKEVTKEEMNKDKYINFFS